MSTHESKPTSTITRRKLLVLGSATTAVAMCPFAGACGPAEGGPVEVGKVSDFEDGLTIVEGKSVIVGKDADGLYAMTAICTHLQCDMSEGTNGDVSDDTLTCNCHGSQYDVNGEPANDTPPEALEHYKVTVDGDTVTVEVGTVVSADERVEV
jgi:Rieske Fe-S protein